MRSRAGKEGDHSLIFVKHAHWTKKVEQKPQIGFISCTLFRTPKGLLMTKNNLIFLKIHPLCGSWKKKCNIHLSSLGFETVTSWFLHLSFSNYSVLTSGYFRSEIWLKWLKYILITCIHKPANLPRKQYWFLKNHFDFRWTLK